MQQDKSADAKKASKKSATEGAAAGAPTPTGRNAKQRTPKRKVCIFCIEKSEYIDYKDTPKLRRFTTEKGKIVPRRTSGNCAKHQRVLATAIKNARIMALMPFKAE